MIAMGAGVRHARSPVLTSSGSARQPRVVPDAVPLCRWSGRLGCALSIGRFPSLSG